MPNTLDLIYNEILHSKKVRENLSTLRKEYPTFSVEEQAALQSHMEKDQDFFISLFTHEDAKARKNLALLLGDLALSSYLSTLFKYYQLEETLFVRSSYLNAMSKMDSSQFIPALKEILILKNAILKTVENQKHLQEECHLLSEIILQHEGSRKHTFNGFTQPSDIVLLVNPLHKEATSHQITEGEVFSYPLGLRVKTNSLVDILPIRTYKEILFLVPNMQSVSKDKEQISSLLSSREMMSYIKKRHKEDAPFTFRLSVKDRQASQKRTSFIKQTALLIESKSNGALINQETTGEIDFRLLETKDGTYHIFIKFYTIFDRRFTYRTEVLSTGIKPQTAALLVQILKEYFVDDARVLDPFCGSGTLLIERQMIKKANTSYGIDIFSEAIEKARINTQQAEQIIHFINRDFFDFTHEYLFDEIFTNLPFVGGHITRESVLTVYQNFFSCAKTHLTKEGKIYLYSHDYSYVQKYAPMAGFTILKKFKINEKNDTWLFILS